LVAADATPARDAESVVGDFDLPPIVTRTWFHNGAWLEERPLEAFFKDPANQEFFAGDPQASFLPDTDLPTGLRDNDTREQPLWSPDRKQRNHARTRGLPGGGEGIRTVSPSCSTTPNDLPATNVTIGAQTRAGSAGNPPIV
jgi:hypothetical protein